MTDKKKIKVLLYESCLKGDELNMYLKIHNINIILIVNSECTVENMLQEQRKYEPHLKARRLVQIRREPMLVGLYDLCILPEEEYEIAVKLQRHCSKIVLVNCLNTTILETEKILNRSWTYIHEFLQEQSGETKKSKDTGAGSSKKRTSR